MSESEKEEEAAGVFAWLRGASRALAASLVAWLGISCGLWVVLPPSLWQTLLPFATATQAAVIAFLAVHGLRSQASRRALRPTAVAFGIGAAITWGIILVRPSCLDPREFDSWTPLVAGAGLVAWIGSYFIERRLGRRHPLATPIIAGLALAAVLVHNALPLYGALTGTHLRTWNVYHYYVGSKYFPELGYRDLYAATLAADDDWLAEGGDPQRGFAHVKKTRDMGSYNVVRRKEATAGFDRSVIPPRRLEELGRDTRSLRPRLSDELWTKVMRDWGYNPAPPWTALGVPVSNAVSPEGAGFWLIANSDVPLFVLMFAALWWAFGLRSAVIATLWVNVIHFNRGRFPGGFLQYDWLASAVLALCLYKRHKGALSGIALAWGAATRVFPGLMAVPIALALVCDAFRKPGPLWQRLDRRRLRFVVALAVGVGLFSGAACLSGRGANVWVEWLQNIMRHADVLHLDAMHVGAGRLAQHTPRNDDFWGGHRSGSREEKLEAARPYTIAIQVAGALLLLLAIFGRKDEDAMILTLFAVFLAVTVTRYYASIWVLLFLLGAHRRDERIRAPAVIAGAFLLGMAAWFYAPGKNWARYTVANWEALLMFVAVCVFYGVENLRRLRAHGRA